MPYNEGTPKASGDTVSAVTVSSLYPEILDALTQNSEAWFNTLSQRGHAARYADDVSTDMLGVNIPSLWDDPETSDPLKQLAFDIVFARDPQVFEAATAQVYADNWESLREATLKTAPLFIAQALRHNGDLAPRFKQLAEGWFSLHEAYSADEFLDDAVKRCLLAASPLLSEQELRDIFDQLKFGKNFTFYYGGLGPNFDLLAKPGVPLSVKMDFVDRAIPLLDSPDKWPSQTVRDGLRIAADYLVTGKGPNDWPVCDLTEETIALGEHIGTITGDEVISLTYATGTKALSAARVSGGRQNHDRKSDS